jgi:hypothetical protein
MRIGAFDPGLITAGRLRKVLGDWRCLGAVPVYALYRKSSRMAPKIAAFLEFVAQAFEQFDPDEVTLTHCAGFGESVRRPRSGSEPAERRSAEMDLKLKGRSELFAERAPHSDGHETNFRERTSEKQRRYTRRTVRVIADVGPHA